MGLGGIVERVTIEFWRMDLLNVSLQSLATVVNQSMIILK